MFFFKKTAFWPAQVLTEGGGMGPGPGTDFKEECYRIIKEHFRRQGHDEGGIIVMRVRLRIPCRLVFVSQ